jgi:enamine deaminase RidA (YjgF/YER057c/UK114 family)
MTSRVRSGSQFEESASYSRAARVGNVVAVSGTAALDDHGGILFPGDVYRQTKAALEVGLEAAATLGAKSDRVLRTRVFLAPGSDWREATRAHGEIFAGVDPANTTLFAGGFIPPGCLVEIEIDAIAD